MPKINNPTVAIVHDILDAYGGAERVVEQLIKVWPQADLYVSIDTHNPQTNSIREKVEVIPTFLQKLPFSAHLKKFYTPLLPIAFETINLAKYDLIISSTAHFAKAVLTTSEQQHICYCHTPPRFLYGYSHESGRRDSWYLKPFINLLDHHLRQYDFIIAQRPDFFITNSQNTLTRIKKFYNRHAVVINPPVDITHFCPSPSATRDYFLVVSRLVKYKNIDTVIKAFNQRPSERLIIVGQGSELQNLKPIAEKNVQFMGHVDHADLAKLYANARALVFSATDEDFGITPIEAMASGTPVIAHKSGGVTETINESETGTFYEANSMAALDSAINRFIKRENWFQQNAITIAAHAKNYSQQSFRDKMQKFVENLPSAKANSITTVIPTQG